MIDSLYTRLCSALLFPLHEQLKGHRTVSKKKRLERSQWQNRTAIKQQQQLRLYEFLNDTADLSPYYRELFHSLKLNNQDLYQPDILKQLPRLDKETIRLNFDGLLSPDACRPKFMSTSGSSGEPLKFVMGNDRVSHDVAAKWRATQWWGVDIGDKEAVIWGSNIEISGQGMMKQLRDKLFRSRLFPAHNLDKKGLLSLFQQLTDYQPAMIYGYPSILSLLAEVGAEQGLHYPAGQLKVIFCTAETLYDHQRKTIESVFKAPVANGYGSRDAGFIAHQCPAGNLHISAEDIIIEILDDEGNRLPLSQDGEIVVTHMATRDFPIIRYRTGDIGALSEQNCCCGRGLPILAHVVGRANDLLLASDGRKIHGAYIGNIIREDPAISHFQLTQTRVSTFELKVVPYQGQTPDEMELISKLGGVLGEDSDISILTVQRINAAATGKFKYIINNIDNKAQ